VGLHSALFFRYDTGYVIKGGVRSLALHIFELHLRLYTELSMKN